MAGQGDDDATVVVADVVSRTLVVSHSPAVVGQSEGERIGITFLPAHFSKAYVLSVALETTASAATPITHIDGLEFGLLRLRRRAETLAINTMRLTRHAGGNDGDIDSYGGFVADPFPIPVLPGDVVRIQIPPLDSNATPLLVVALLISLLILKY